MAPSRIRIPALAARAARPLAAGCCLLLLAAPPARTEVLSPESAWESDPTLYSSGLALGDVDLDGDLDLVVANKYGRKTLYLGEDGRLHTEPDWSSAPPHRGTQCAALGDLDGDGFPELACGNQNGQANQLYANLAGAFTDTPVWESSATWDTQDLALGDLDGDGDLDLFCANRDAPSNWYRNDGGVLTAEPAWSTGAGDVTLTQAVALGDVDGDGDVDVVLGNDGQSLQLYLNDGSGLPVTPSWEGGLGERVFGLALGDLDGDGDLDLVCGNSGNEPNTGYAFAGGGYGAGPVWTSTEGLATRAVDLGDLDGDGDLDLACGNHAGPNTVYLNDGGILEVNPVWYSDPQDTTEDAALADVDGDGHLDLVCVNYAQSDHLYPNLGMAFAAEPAWSSKLEELNTQTVVLADLDRDGDLDLICGCGQPAQVLRAYENVDGDFGDAPAWASAQPHDSWALAVGDVDGDGWPDLVSGNALEPCTVHFGGTDGLEDSPGWSSGDVRETYGVALCDVDGDGDLDLVRANRLVAEGDVNTLHRNEGGVLTSFPVWSSDPVRGRRDTRCLALGDVDGDGAPDLVCGNAPGDSSTAYLNRGGVFSTVPDWISTQDDGAPGLDLADVDGDGDLDLVCAQGVSSADRNDLYWNRWDEGGDFGEPQGLTQNAAITLAVATGDVNADGRLDLVCGNDDPNRLFLNLGSGWATSPVWSDLDARTTSVALGDVDRDGDLDLVCGNDLSVGREQRELLYLNTGQPPAGVEPDAPSARLPDHPPWLRDAAVAWLDTNLYRLEATLRDLEGDPAWVTVEYQFRGEPVWRPAAVAPGSGNRLGPLAPDSSGTAVSCDWDVRLLSLDDRPVVLRLRATSSPRRVAHVQEAPAYLLPAGRLDVRRPRITTGTDHLVFAGAVTWGDTVSAVLNVANTGTDTLRISGLTPPSDALLCGLDLPIVLAPGASLDLELLLAPTDQPAVAGPLVFTSNDWVDAAHEVQVDSDVRPLAVTTRALAPTDPAPLGQALTVVVEPAPGVVVERGWLFHRPQGSGQAYRDSIPLVLAEENDEDFIAVIPDEAVTEAGLDYYVRVENSSVHVNDPATAPAGAPYSIDVAAPNSLVAAAVPNSGADYLAGRPVRVEAILPDGTEFQSGFLHYRRGGESAYRSLPLDPDSGRPVATIPDSLVDARGLAYWLEVQCLSVWLSDPDTAGIGPDPGVAPHTLAVTVPDLAEPAAAPGGRYRMVSVPLEFLPARNLEDLLSEQDEFGEYDVTVWRCFRWASDLERYVEFNAENARFALAPGRAYWLVARARNRITTAPGLGTSTPADAPCEIVLEPGWNQVGHPFAFPVAWDAVRAGGTAAAADDSLGGPVGRDPAAQQYVFDVATLEPFGGYWIENRHTGPVTLAVPPEEAPAAALRLASPAASKGDVSGWRLRIVACCGEVRDGHNFVGSAPSARIEWDGGDRSEPPACPGRTLALHFPHEDWSSGPACLTVDLRPAAAGQSWCFDVAKNFAADGMADEIALSFPDLAALPAELTIVLQDRLLERTVDPRAEPVYAFAQGRRDRVTSEDGARFRLIVGGPDWVEEQLDLPLLPIQAALHPNRPNPFNPHTLIRFDLPASTRATLRVYDLTGALVRTLRQGTCAAGRHEVVWRGDDDRGRRVATGVYLYRLETGAGFRQTRKMLLLK